MPNYKFIYINETYYLHNCLHNFVLREMLLEICTLLVLLQFLKYFVKLNTYLNKTTI